MNFDPNGLYYKMAAIYDEFSSSKVRPVICNEGSSRSGKSYDTYELLYTFCKHNRNAGLEIYVMRRTLKNARVLAYKDFKKCLQDAGCFNPDCAFSENSSPIYNAFGNTISFIGLDSSSEAVRSDIIYINEALEIESETLVTGWKRRCEMFMVVDWNPKFTKHWVFDWEFHPNTWFTHTTYKDNKHLRESIIADIESQSPWHLDDLQLKEDKRRPHIENLSNKTANKFEFMVYGMGVRAAREGVVFPDVTWIDKLPDAEQYYYGLDFGFTVDPTCLVKACIKEKKMYAQKLIYKPIKDSSLLAEVLTNLGITDEDIIIADSSDIGGSSTNGFIYDLRCEGFTVIGAKKGKGSIVEGIAKINKFDIYLVWDNDVQEEQENYMYNEINGIKTNTPIDKWNHFWDALRYLMQSPYSAAE